MKKINLLWLTLLISLNSFGRDEGYVIKGKVSGFPDGTVFYLENSQQNEVIDSVYVKDGYFKFEGFLDNEPEQLVLRTKINNRFISVRLLIGNEKISITGDIRNFPYDINIRGSKTQEELNAHRQYLRHIQQERDSFMNVIRNMSDEERAEQNSQISEKMRQLNSKRTAANVKYLKSNLNTHLGVIMLRSMRYHFPKDTVRAMYERLSDDLKFSKNAKDIRIFLGEKISDIGDNYHDFSAINISGDTIRFSDLLGKYILLDFTTAFCGPCIESVKELKEFHHRYPDSLSIVSFSLDINRNTWLKANERDSIPWQSLWDGEGQRSETYIKYGVNSFPTFFLLNPEGRIIKKWVGYQKGLIREKMKSLNFIHPEK